MQGSLFPLDFISFFRSLSLSVSLSVCFFFLFCFLAHVRRASSFRTISLSALFTFQPDKMMNSCGVQQEMRRNAVVSSDRRDAVICPKPRRVGVLSSRSLRWQLNHQMELCESNSRSEILDFILSKGSGGGGEQEACPLFFTGSPPSRVSNPLTKDSLFREELLVVTPPTPSTPRGGANKPQPPSSPRNGSCVRAAAATSFGIDPVVRVVGFDCDRRSSNHRSVSTLA
ncbi:PREDICTED: uncharacterized protein LOC104755623 [Camelina sativa]|uniref:Uncharacterized protein LOC104755623 n=1 Tax=Camelina sativa TaxID=90675 RepID=A0ABM0WUG7_CAMSA|nr:PREDICTED: uncharacterized protein LOC104755623 [Camelina sativa]